MSTTKDRLLIVMHSLGLSQYTLSKQSGVDAAIISRILSGKNDPSIVNLKKIAEATKTSPNWLLGYGSDDKIEKLVRHNITRI